MRYHKPPEWHSDKTIYLGWPFAANLWQNNLTKAQEEFLSVIRALINENICILLPDLTEESKFFNLLGSKSVKTLIMPYADIWLRDTLPIGVKDEENRDIGVLPHFNGWGGKYLFRDDESLSKRFTQTIGIAKVYTPLVMEGGAIECNGEGTLLTTESCLLNPNRNPGLKKKEIEHELARMFGAQKVIWLKGSLKNDHTDGHIDTLARFISPQKIVVMEPRSVLDPNYQVLTEIIKLLEAETDALNRPFELIKLPSPGSVLDEEGRVMPASFLNFLITQNKIIMPIYDTNYDVEAIDTLKKHCPIPVIGLMAKAILTGGGAFHCLSQEVF